MRIWSDVEYVYRCLADAERTSAFREAIEAIMQPGAVVLDLGSGSGIMALLAARAGAARVFAVEVGPYLARASRRIFDESGYGARITSVRGDARTLDLSVIEKPDVVICEMITTGLLGEMQGPVLRSLRRAGVIDEATLLVPEALSTSITLVQADFDFYGIDLRFPIFVDYFSRSFNRPLRHLTPVERVHRASFSSDFSEDVTIDAQMTVNATGSINGLLLSSTTDFLGGPELGSCVSYCQPVILPVSPEIDASPGDTIAVRLRYQMGDGFDSLEHAVERS